MAAPGGPPLDPRSTVPDPPPALRFIVPTPAGPVHLTQLLPKPTIKNSLVVLRTSYAPLQPISELYNAFVSPSGPVGTLGQPVVSTLLEVDGPIDTGRSWEFAVLLLHAHAAGLLTAAAVGDDRPVVVWASGIVAFDPAAPFEAQRLAADTLHLAEKINTSRVFLTAAASTGCRIVALVPDTAEGARAAEALTALLAGQQATVATCATIGAARHALAGTGISAGPATAPDPPAGDGAPAASATAPAAPPPDAAAAPPRPDVPTAAEAGTPGGATAGAGTDGAKTKPRRWWKRVGLAALAAAGIGALVAGWDPVAGYLFPAAAPAGPSPPGQPAPDVAITGLYLPPGRACGTLLFQFAPAARREAARPLADGSGLVLPAANLCALDVQAPPGTRLDLDAALSARFSVAVDEVAPRADWTRLVLRPPAPGGPMPPLELRFTATGASAAGVGVVRLVTTDTPATTSRAGLP